ncbi:MAG: xanthine dehydrogenase large subunit, partial [Paraglaciecola sp.]
MIKFENFTHTGSDIMRKLSTHLGTLGIQGNVGKAHPHESAIRHVTGQARYVDDMPHPANLLHGAVGM